MIFTSPALCSENSVKFSTRSSRRVLVARAANHHLQRHPARLVLALDAFPLEEPLPIRRERADAAVRAVRGDEQRVEHEQRRDAVLRMLVARQIFVERRARGHAGLLQLDDHQRQAVDEAHQIRAAGVERARDAELADQQEIIVRRILPINRRAPARSFVRRAPCPARKP